MNKKFKNGKIKGKKTLYEFLIIIWQYFELCENFQGLPVEITSNKDTFKVVITRPPVESGRRRARSCIRSTPGWPTNQKGTQRWNWHLVLSRAPKMQAKWMAAPQDCWMLVPQAMLRSCLRRLWSQLIGPRSWPTRKRKILLPLATTRIVVLLGTLLARGTSSREDTRPKKRNLSMLGHRRIRRRLIPSHQPRRLPQRHSPTAKGYTRNLCMFLPSCLHSINRWHRTGPRQTVLTRPRTYSRSHPASRAPRKQISSQPHRPGSYQSTGKDCRSPASKPECPL